MSREQRIYDALFKEINPGPVFIENESSRHNVPAGSETHFKIVAVSNVFETLRPVARHRLVNTLLADEFASGLHALSLHLYTPNEWQRQTSGAPSSPPCHNRKT
jgi:BolA protein